MYYVAIAPNPKKSSWQVPTLCAALLFNQSPSSINVKDEYKKLIKVVEDASEKLKRKKSVSTLRDQEVFAIPTETVADLGSINLTFPRNFNNVFRKQDAAAYKFDQKQYEMDSHGALLEGPEGETVKKKLRQHPFPSYGRFEEFGIDYNESRSGSWNGAGSPCQRLYAALVASGATYLSGDNVARALVTFLLHEDGRRLIKGLLLMKDPKSDPTIPGDFKMKVANSGDVSHYEEPLRRLMSDIQEVKAKEAKQAIAKAFSISFEKDKEFLSSLAQKIVDFVWDYRTIAVGGSACLPRLLQSESVWKIDDTSSVNEDSRRLIPQIKRDLRQLQAISLVNNEVANLTRAMKAWGGGPESRHSLWHTRVASRIAEVALEEIRETPFSRNANPEYPGMSPYTPMLLALVKFHLAKKVLLNRADTQIDLLKHKVACADAVELVEVAIMWLLEDTGRRDDAFLVIAEALKANMVVFTSDKTYTTYLIPRSDSRRTPFIFIKFNTDNSNITCVRILGNDKHQVQANVTAEDIFKMGLKLNNCVFPSNKGNEYDAFYTEESE